MMNLFKKQQVKEQPQQVIVFTVEQIHAEIDSAQDRLLCEAERVLAELQIPTQTQLENKAAKLEALGFKKSVTVSQADVFKQERKKIETTAIQTKEFAQALEYYKYTYPYQKFISIEEMDKICAKYGLIYAPVSAYVNDVPEKNVNEMMNLTPLKEDDVERDVLTLKIIRHWHQNTPEQIEKIGDVIDITNCTEDQTADFKRGHGDWVLKHIMPIDGVDIYFSKAEVETTQRKGFFIAAPPSHFDLSELSKDGKHGYSQKKVIEVTDPIVFEYCRGGFIRVCTKWGTPDDQAYLDPSLTNETLN